MKNTNGNKNGNNKVTTNGDKNMKTKTTKPAAKAVKAVKAGKGPKAKAAKVTKPEVKRTLSDAVIARMQKHIGAALSQILTDAKDAFTNFKKGDLESALGGLELIETDAAMQGGEVAQLAEGLGLAI